MIELTARELLNWARFKSPFYKELYSTIKEDEVWEDIPIVEQSLFWKANSWKDNTLLTNQKEKGIIFKSGGTTGNPKFSYFSDREWTVFCQEFGESMGEANLEDGDHVGNMFYGGELYASFLFIHKSLELSGKSIIEFPLAGKMANEDLVTNILEFNIDVLCGVPTSFIQLASHCLEFDIKLPLKKLLYGGEAIYSDQLDILLNAFPDVAVHSVGYASVDAGMLGKRSADCSASEHQVFSKSTLMEIVDDEGRIIDVPDVEGRLLVTNLTRKLMPIIRYPVGDQAKWIEVGKKFALCGRSQEGARIGPITFNRDDLISILSISETIEKTSQFQMIVTHFDGLDCLEINIVLKKEEQINLKQLEEVFYDQRKMFLSSVEGGIVHPVVFNICSKDDLFKNPRTGKCPVIVDKRLV